MKAGSHEKYGKSFTKHFLNYQNRLNGSKVMLKWKFVDLHYFYCKIAKSRIFMNIDCRSFVSYLTIQISCRGIVSMDIWLGYLYSVRKLRIFTALIVVNLREWSILGRSVSARSVSARSLTLSVSLCLSESLSGPVFSWSPMVLVDF